MSKFKFDIIKIPVSEAGQSVRFSADANKMYNWIEGLYFSLPEDKAIVGSSLELKIANEEIFPEAFEVKLISSGQDCPTNERFFDLIHEEAKGNRIDGRFIDSGKADQYPYVAKLYLMLQERN